MEGVSEAEISVLIAGGENTHKIGSPPGWREAGFNIIESGPRSSIMWFLGMLSPHRSWRKVLPGKVSGPDGACLQTLILGWENISTALNWQITSQNGFLYIFF